MTSPLRSSASLTDSTTTWSDPTVTSGATARWPVTVRTGRLSAYPCRTASATSAPNVTAHRNTCAPWSASGSGNSGARSSESRTRDPERSPTRNRVMSCP